MSKSVVSEIIFTFIVMSVIAFIDYRTSNSRINKRRLKRRETPAALLAIQKDYHCAKCGNTEYALFDLKGYSTTRSRDPLMQNLCFTHCNKCLYADFFNYAKDSNDILDLMAATCEVKDYQCPKCHHDQYMSSSIVGTASAVLNDITGEYPLAYASCTQCKYTEFYGVGVPADNSDVNRVSISKCERCNNKQHIHGDVAVSGIFFTYLTCMKCARTELYAGELKRERYD